MIKNNCPVCSEEKNIDFLCEVNNFEIFTCLRCCADHVFPAPGKEILKEYYDREEWFEGGEPGGYQNYDAQTAWSVDAISASISDFGDVQGLSILDIGCGYGTHLELAAAKGWKCFGVELSNHARKIATERLEGKAYIVESVSDLVPHEFDLILILDVIEHLPSPYELMYSLFSIGAITSKTRIVITTPNAGSDDALQHPADWSYRHPPSHLVYYSADSIRFLLEKLRFSGIDVHGISPTKNRTGGNYNVDDIKGYAGLWATAMGSDFTEFMRERYVPGTWSKISEYEHLPRYQLAKRKVVGKSVLDFGCGTGYGSSIMSESASSVVGLDIDQSAIYWAKDTHHNKNLNFYCSGDLGASLPSESFDIVTCFEMIEHVDHITQTAVIASIARLLRSDGLFIISTPNPETTKLYGANPYHLREMTLKEFNEILVDHFPYITILEQRVRNSIAFDAINQTKVSKSYFKLNNKEGKDNVVSLAFVAICSKVPLKNIDSTVFFDEEVDLIQDTLTNIGKLTSANFNTYKVTELLNAKNIQNNNQNIELIKYLDVLSIKETIVIEKETEIQQQAKEIERLYQMVLAKDDAVIQQATEIERLDQMVLAKDDAVIQQAKEIERLDQMVLSKDDAVVQQATEIERLDQIVVTKDRAVNLQGKEIERLDQMVLAKDDAVIQQATEIERLDQMILTKDDAVHKQAREISRLDQIIVTKDRAVNVQAKEIERLDQIIVAKDKAILYQTNEIERLYQLVVIKDEAVRQQITEIERLNQIIIAKDRAITLQTTEIKRLDEVNIKKDEAINQYKKNITHLNESEQIHNETIILKNIEINSLVIACSEQDQVIAGMNTHLTQQAEEITRLDESMLNKQSEIKRADVELRKLYQSKWYRLENAVKTRPVNLKSVKQFIYITASIVIPPKIRNILKPLIVNRNNKKYITIVPEVNIKTLQESNAGQSNVTLENVIERPRIIHVIANFCVGGSSRLVIDLIESLGSRYEQSVLTSFIPVPPAYTGINIQEYRFPENEQPFINYFESEKPNLIHVHYWGDCDEPWYAKAFKAAEILGIPIVENVNTPVDPYFSPAVKHYVYVSNYVRNVFGRNETTHTTIFPGSDFSHFCRAKTELAAENCVGMVYRLERDKLNDDAILPFISAVIKRPSTQVLIVGGGSLLDVFRQTVEKVGLSNNFEFTDYVSYATLPDFYRRMTIFVAPVWKESFGQVSAFAMNMRIPVCGYDVGAIGEIIDNPKLTSPVAAHDQLAEIIVRLLDSPTERAIVGEQQQKRAQEHFSVQSMIESYRQIYQQLISIQIK